MFGKKKLYKIKYKWISIDTTIIEAKDKYQALKKLKKEFFVLPDIISIEEVYG
jgi:hypothetical protein